MGQCLHVDIVEGYTDLLMLLQSSIYYLIQNSQAVKKRVRPPEKAMVKKM